MIDIDGSFGEGGGQILRSSLALSLLTGKPFRLRHIRAKRPKPGLQPQHLMSVRAAGTIGNAKLSGDAVSSQSLTFEPGEVTAGNYRFAIGTAGATALVLHTVYLPLALRGIATSEITLEGGTHVSTSPCFHFLQFTWAKHLERLGMQVSLDMRRPGFYPRGGGQVIAHIQPCANVQTISLVDRPQIRQAIGVSAGADVPDHVAKRQAQRLRELLFRHDVSAEFELQKWQGGPGSMIGVQFPELPISPFFFALGARGKSAEAVADEAADEAIKYLHADAPVDEHSADQLLLPLAFADGVSEFRVATVSLHLTTNAAVIQQFHDCEIEIDGEEGQPGLVRIVGHRV